MLVILVSYLLHCLALEKKTHPTCITVLLLRCIAVRPHVHLDDQPVLVTNQQLQPSQGESIFGDSSGPLFSMYSKIAEEEDNEMAERWQKDADGLLIFVSRVGIHNSLYNPGLRTQ